MPTPSSYAFSHRNAATELLFLFLPFSFGGGESSLPISFSEPASRENFAR